MKKFKLISTIIGYLLLAIAAFWYFNIKSTIDSYELTNGIVIEADDTAVILFKDKNGKEIEFETTISCEPPCYSLNESVDIYYNPNNPENEHEIKGTLLWIGPLIVGSTGFLFFIIGFILMMINLFRNKKEKYLREHGVELKTEYVSCTENRNIAVNGKHPYIIRTKWFDNISKKTHNFKSINIWNLTNFDRNKEITVFVDVNDYNKYFMDISFLEE